MKTYPKEKHGEIIQNRLFGLLIDNADKEILKSELGLTDKISVEVYFNTKSLTPFEVRFFYEDSCREFTVVAFSVFYKDPSVTVWSSINGYDIIRENFNSICITTNRDIKNDLRKTLMTWFNLVLNQLFDKMEFI